MAGGRGYRVNLTPLAPSQTPGRSPLNLYYDPEHPLWHKRPDWMLSVGVPWLYGGQDLRLSYVTWQEGKGPEVVVEFLSPGLSTHPGAVVAVV